MQKKTNHKTGIIQALSMKGEFMYILMNKGIYHFEKVDHDLETLQWILSRFLDGMGHG